MPLEARLLAGLTLAVTVVYWATPLAIRVANRFEFYDKPAGYKGHARPTPYLGGAAVVTGFVVALLLLASDWSRSAPVAAGVVVLWVVGTVDDRRNVAWWVRVLVEVALAALLWATGLGWDLGAGGILDLVVTIGWLVAVVNAFNLFDNMDGQSATMGLVASCGLVTLALVNGDTWLAVAAAALAGACFGFLPHNLLSQPARIFLGDGGSMPLGFAVASLTMVGSVGASSDWRSLALGLLLVGVPALDTTLVIVSRRRRGISLLTGGRDHLTHRARQRLRTTFAVAVALGSAQILLSIMAVAAARGSSVALETAGVLYLLALGVAVLAIDTRLPAVPPEPVATIATQRSGWWQAIPRQTPLLVVLGVGAGISPLLAGYYEATAWAPLGLAVLVCLLAASIARPLASRRAWIALFGLAALGLWALLSTLWANSVENAFVDANRILALAATLALLATLVRDRASALWVVGAFTAASLAVELIEIVRLLGSDPASQFLAGRLHKPLGYINAQATASLMTLWPLLALAEQRRRPWLAGGALAGVVLSGGLVLLSESRGAALAVLGSVLFVTVIVPGRQRRLGALVVAAAGIAVAGGPLLGLYQDGISAGRVHHAVTLLVVAALVCGLVWAVVVRAERSLGDAHRVLLRRSLTALTIVAALAVAIVGLASTGRIGDEINRQYDAFVNLSPSNGGEPTASRLLSGAGNRYDYWRIAKDAFADHPVLGLGAGNYDETYFLERRTTEDIRQPHSLILQAMSELGLPGLLLVLIFLGGVLWAAVSRRADALASRTERGLLVAGAGTFATWAVHTQVDWIHLLPGITAGSLIAAAVLLRPQSGETVSRLPRLALLLILVPIAIAGVSLSRQVLTQHHAGRAQSALDEGRPEAAVREANRALRLDGDDVNIMYTKAAAFARLGDADAADRTLKAALRSNPNDFLTYALLGDLSVRRRRLDEAANYYGEALKRNPRDPTLQAAARAAGAPGP